MSLKRNLLVILFCLLPSSLCIFVFMYSTYIFLCVTGRQFRCFFFCTSSYYFVFYFIVVIFPHFLSVAYACKCCQLFAINELISLLMLLYTIFSFIIIYYLLFVLAASCLLIFAHTRTLHYVLCAVFLLFFSLSCLASHSTHYIMYTMQS